MNNYNTNYPPQQPVPAVGVPFPITVQELNGDFLKEIERLAIECHTTKITASLPKTVSFAIDTKSHYTHVQLHQNNQIVGGFPFMNGELLDIMAVQYSPALGLEAGYFVSVNIENAQLASFFIPQKTWRTKKMLRAFQDDGIVFLSKGSESSHLTLLNNLLAQKCSTTSRVTADPRPGWHNWATGRSYWYRDHIPLPEIPTWVDCATLLADDISPGAAFVDFVNTLRPCLDDSLFHLLKAVLGLGILYSLLTTPLASAQESFLIFQGPASVRRWLLHFLSPIQDPDLPLISLNIPPKTMAAVLDKYRDRPLAIDVDNLIESKQTLENMAKLQAYVHSGICPSGHPTSCPVIFLCTTPPNEISLEDALIVDFTDVNLGFLAAPGKLAVNFAHGLIQYISANADVLTPSIASDEACQNNRLVQLLVDASRIVDNIFDRTIKNAPCDTNNSLRQFLTAAEESACYFGVSEAFLECLVHSLESGSLKICRASKAYREDLSSSLLVTRAFLLVSDELLTTFILPEIFTAPLSPTLFRKQLEEEGLLLRETSYNGQKSLKRRVRLKDGPGPWMTAIPLDALNYATEDFDIAELLEVI